MLVLARKVNQRIRIGPDATIVVVDIRDDKVKIGIEAPRDMDVDRQEVWEKVQKHGRRPQQRRK